MVPMAITPFRIFIQPQQLRILMSIDEFSIHKPNVLVCVFVVFCFKYCINIRKEHNCGDDSNQVKVNLCNRVF